VRVLISIEPPSATAIPFARATAAGRSVPCITVEARPICCHLHLQPREQTMNDRDHLEAVCLEAVCVELRDEELAEVSGGAIYMNFDGVEPQVTTEGFRNWIEL
jgi:hypothetical protein